MKKRLEKIKILIDEKGIALVIVLMLLTVSSILALALMGLTLNNLKMSSSERTYQSSYYIAESGINYMMDKVNTDIVDIYNNSENASLFFSNVENMLSELNNQSSYKGFEGTFGHKPEAKISIEKIFNNNSNSTDFRDYKILSIGTIDNRSRTVEKQFRLTWQPKSNVIIPDTAVFVKDSIALSGGASVIGGFGTNSSAPSSIKLDGGASISGNIYVGPSSGSTVIDKPDWMELNNTIIKLPYPKTFETPQFPVFPSNPIPPNEKVYSSSNSYNVIYNGSLRIDNWIADDYTLAMIDDMQFNDITITSNNTLNINVGNGNRNIVVNDLNLPNGKIKINGSGKLTIYVKHNITMGSGSVINTSDEIENFSKGGNEETKLQLIKSQIKKLEIFYRGTSLNLSGSQKIYGSLYAQNAELTFTGGSGFQGQIISGGNKITINGGANAVTQLIYAPNADIILSGGASIKGSIIAESYTASGGSKLTFNNLDIDDLPPVLGGTSGGTISSKDIIFAEPSREK